MKHTETSCSWRLSRWRPAKRADKIARKLADHVVTDDLGMRSVPADIAQKFFEDRAARDEKRQELKASRRAPAPVIPAGKPGDLSRPAIDVMMEGEPFPDYEQEGDERVYGPGFAFPTSITEEHYAATARDRLALQKELTVARMKRDLQ